MTTLERPISQSEVADLMQCPAKRGYRFKRGTPFWDRVKRSDGCWVWLGGCNDNGYGLVYGGGKEYAHRRAWELTNGPVPPGMWVLHHCDNPPCVRPDHLFLGVRQDNVTDMVKKGRNHRPRGVAHPRVRLSASDIVCIRTMSAWGMSKKALSCLFNVHPAHIGRIVNRKRWS